MNTTEFTNLDRRCRTEDSSLFELSSPSTPAEDSDIISLEANLGVCLPSEYSWFLRNYGGGEFGLLTVFSASPDSEWYLGSKVEEASKFIPEGFLPISDDFAGGYYGFLISDSVALSKIHYWNSDGGLVETEFDTVLDFIARFAYEPA